MPIVRNLWISDNGKYKVLVRKFEDDQILVSFWQISKQGQNKHIWLKDLPQYVVDQIDLMKAEVS